MAANLEKLRKDSRFQGTRAETLQGFVDRFRAIVDFPKRVVVRRSDGGYYPVEAIGQRIKSIGKTIGRYDFKMAGQIVINQSRRWEHEDGFITRESLVIEDGSAFYYSEGDGVVVLNGKKIPLSKIDNRIFGYVGRNADIALSRNEIIQHVWGDNTEGINNHPFHLAILRLRGKIEIDPSHPQRLVTIKGKHRDASLPGKYIFYSSIPSGS